MNSLKSKLAAIAAIAALSMGVPNREPAYKPLTHPAIEECRKIKQKEPHIDRGAITSPYRGRKVPRWKRKKQKKGKK